MPAIIYYIQSTLMNKYLLFGALGTIALGTAVYASGALADQTALRNFGPNYTPERHEQMTKAFENNDFAAWKSLMGDRGAARTITAETFPKFTEMHNLKLEGKTDEANKIRTELGLGTKNGSGQNKGLHGRGRQGNFVDANNDGVCDHQK